MREFLIFFLFLVFPICGIQSLMEGNIGMGVFFLLPLVFVLCVFAYQQLYQKPLEKQYNALHKKYQLPKYVADDDYGALEKKFQEVIAKAIESTSDNAKISDLKHCQRVIKEMNKSCVGSYTWLSSFSKIYKAFRLTGCHLKVTDSEGNNITKII